MNQETHKGENYRLGFQQGVKETKADLVKLIERMVPKDTKNGNVNCNPMCHESGKHQALSDLLTHLKD